MNLRIKINNKILIVPSDYTFYKVTSSLYYSRIAFGNNNLNNIIGSPFFLAFHTLFDKENESLHFYPEKRDFLEEDSNLSTIIPVVLIIILLIVLLGFIIYKFILWQKAKREKNEGFPSSNYYNNIHGYNQNFL